MKQAFVMRPAIDVLAVAGMLGVVVLGFAASFDGPGYLIPAIGGLVLGVLIGVIGARRQWNSLGVAAAVVVAIVVFGGALALPRATLWGVPTLTTLRELGLGIVTSWKDAITSAPPLLWDAGHGLVPFLLLLVAGALATSLALRLQNPMWTLLPLAAAFALQAGLGVADTLLPVVQGTALAIVAVGWLGWRHANDPSRFIAELHGETTIEAVHGARNRRLVTGAVVLAAAAAVGVASSVALPAPVDRAVLRDGVVPPLDVRDYASPLQSFRAYVRDASEEAQFTVTGMPDGARLRLAAMDAYNGTVLDVSGSTGTFAPLRTDRTGAVDGDVTTMSVEVGDYNGSFVPTVGDVANLTYRGVDAAALGRAGYFNAETATLISARRLVRGDAYDLTTGIVPAPSTSALADAQFAEVTMPEQTGVPDAISSLASAIVVDADTPWQKVTALRDWLVSNGYFSHGLEGDAPSLSGHGAVRLQSLIDDAPITGDDEQYAVAMVLLADRLGIPARAVMGWHADADDAATGDTFFASGSNLHVWVEIAFAGYGWVAMDVTPPEDKEPAAEEPQPLSDARPQVLQPPPAEQDAAEDPLTNPDGRDALDGDGEDEEATPGPAWGVIAAITGGALICLALPPAAIVALKALRRRRRAHRGSGDERVAGAWDEVVDRARDLRVDVTPGVSRLATARALTPSFPGVDVLTLAGEADARVFGPGAVSDGVAGSFWADTESVIHAMMHSRSRGRRMRAKISLRSLIRRRGARAEQGRRSGDMGKEAAGDPSRG